MTGVDRVGRYGEIRREELPVGRRQLRRIDYLSLVILIADAHWSLSAFVYMTLEG